MVPTNKKLIFTLFLITVFVSSFFTPTLGNFSSNPVISNLNAVENDQRFSLTNHLNKNAIMSDTPQNEEIFCHILVGLMHLLFA